MTMRPDAAIDTGALLERSVERETIESALDAAVQGSGRCVTM